MNSLKSMNGVKSTTGLRAVRRASEPVDSAATSLRGGGNRPPGEARANDGHSSHGSNGSPYPNSSRRARKRRGVILLIVLSLLVIFTLMATTFLIVSGEYQSGARLSARLTAKRTNPRKLTDNAVLPLLVDSDDPSSAIRFHGLFRDMYGDDGFTGSVQALAVLPATSGGLQVEQFFDVQLVNPAAGTPNFLRGVPRDYEGRPYPLRQTRDYYNGQVLTFVDGPAAGMSTRIIDYDPATSGFRVMPIEGNTTALPVVGSRVVVNGRPFSGSGFGYNPLSGQADGWDPGLDGEWGFATVDDDGNGIVDDYIEAGTLGSDDFRGMALQPNRVPGAVRVAGNPVMNASKTAQNAYLWGGADESYDAADYQNMHLAAVVPNPTNPNRSFVLPSFHRPALINWWLFQVILPAMTSEMNNPPTPAQLFNAFLMPYGPDNIPDDLPFDHPEAGSADDPTYITPVLRHQIATLKRRIILRPLPEANPHFTGSNPQFTSSAFNTVDAAHLNPYVAGSWDVDNDGDGDSDSVWLDVGLPVQENSDGRLYKPLVAILCTDLDGRLNINAQGGLGHLFAKLPAAVDHPRDLAGNTDFTTAALIPGVGTGPADVNLGVLFGNALYERLLTGGGPPVGRSFPGRYGADKFPGVPGFNAANRTRDFLAWAKFYQYPSNFHALDAELATPVAAADTHGAFESPPDLNGEVMVALDHRGQPRFTTQSPSRNLLVDHAYEKNLLTPSRSDQLFTISELEGLLRFHDEDKNPHNRPPLSQRLTKLFEVAPGQNMFTSPAPRPPFPQNAPPNFFTPLNRRTVTTLSFDLPVPNMVEPPDLAVFDPTNPAHRILKPQAATNFNLRLHHVSEILRARLIQNMDGGTTAGWAIPEVATTWNATHEERLNVQISALLSHDLRSGLRMDINRPFGNGRDDNQNGVVDEHGFGLSDGSGIRRNLEASLWHDGLDNNGNGSVDEQGEEEKLWANAAFFDHDNDGVVLGDRDAFLARAHYARHLYVLMMMLKDPLYFTDVDVDRDGMTGAMDPTDTARLFAQYAVNAVDFRDADSIMTPFEFDLRPFTPHPGQDGAWGEKGVDDDGLNGTDDIGEAMWPNSDDLPPWSVDGLVGANPGQDGQYGTGDDFDDAAFNPDRALVWGLERPELLITETLAFHDRRTEDLDTDDGAGEFTMLKNPLGADPNFDQRLRPRGSFYVELYNPWASRSLRKPAEFYNGASRINGVVLDKLTPVDPSDSATARSPVWRMLVVDSDVGEGGTADVDSPFDASRWTPNEDDRVIYFGRHGPAAGTAKVFPDPATPPTSPLVTDPDDPSPFAPLLGGRYAVVGTVRGAPLDLPEPSAPAGTGSSNGIFDWVNTIGRRTDVAENQLTSEVSRTRRIVLQPDPDPNQNRVFVEENDTAVAMPIPFELPIDYDPRTSSAPTAPSRSNVVDSLPPVAIPVADLNVSEELGGTTYPTLGFDPTLADNEGGYEPPLDFPLDVAPYLMQDGMHVNGTMIDSATWKKVVHLQRLANPLQPWNPYPGESAHDPNFPVNPYMTVDSMAIDLASFNGVTTDADPDNTAGSIDGFFSRQRGEEEVGGVETRTLWKRGLFARTTPPAPTGNTVLNHYLTVDLHHSLGFLNDLPNGNYIHGPRFKFDFSDSSNSTAPSIEFVGSPDTNLGPPFPWLTWLNRPFISQYELLQIPRTSSYDLLRLWGVFDRTRDKSPYQEDELAEFNHLLNFLASTIPTAGGAPPKPAPNLARMLDFTHVPSPFVGTETLLTPAVFGHPTEIAVGTEALHPPFNRVSKFREPGKINLNTAYAPVVIDAIRGASGISGVGPLFEQIADSRRGFGDRPDLGGTPPNYGYPPAERRSDGPMSFILSGTQIPSFNPHPNNPTFDDVVLRTPTVFANPFRGFGDGQLSTLPRWRRPPIEATMLRSTRIDPGEDPVKVMDQWPQAPAVKVDAPLLVRARGFAHNNPHRNSYFRYEAMQRFANLVTTRSNVYAIWVTVGFFEVENVTPTPINPFGYRLGSELGWDTGEISRHRAFYVVDRSVPVAFEPGKRHNVDKAILVRRFIE